MNVYTMVAVICIAAAAVPIGVVWLVSRARTKGFERRVEMRLAPVLAALDETQARLAVLEAIAVDPERRLTREMAALR